MATAFHCLSPIGTSGELGGIRQIKIEPDELNIIQITVPGSCWGPTMHRQGLPHGVSAFCFEKRHLQGVSQHLRFPHIPEIAFLSWKEHMEECIEVSWEHWKVF